MYLFIDKSSWLWSWVTPASTYCENLMTRIRRGWTKFRGWLIHGRGHSLLCAKTLRSLLHIFLLKPPLVCLKAKRLMEHAIILILYGRESCVELPELCEDYLHLNKSYKSEKMQVFKSNLKFVILPLIFPPNISWN